MLTQKYINDIAKYVVPLVTEEFAKLQKE